MKAGEKAQFEAMKRSYLLREGGLTIPKESLVKIVEIPLGFQPFSLTAYQNIVVGTDYFGPSVFLATVSNDDEGMHFDLEWIGGALNYSSPWQRFINSIKKPRSIRLFPRVPRKYGANRATGAFLLDENTLCVMKNTERDVFVYKRPVNKEEKWKLVQVARLPENPLGGFWFVHSVVANLRVNSLITIESTRNLERWKVFCYYIDSSPRKLKLSKHRHHLFNVFPYCYGIDKGLRGISREEGPGVIWLINNLPSRRKGLLLYEGREIFSSALERDLTGTGLCKLEDGSILVAQHGQSHPGAFNGVPGTLTYVPAEMLKV